MCVCVCVCVRACVRACHTGKFLACLIIGCPTETLLFRMRLSGQLKAGLKTKCLLVTYWLHIGYILVIYWLPIGYILVIYWLPIGYILVTYWLYIGYILVIYWLYIFIHLRDGGK